MDKHKIKNLKNKPAFTLVELIIVITILAILATIAFISFKNYSGNARDGNKLTTLSNIENGLNLYQVKTGSYPTPDDIYGSGNYSGTLLSQVGFVGTGVIQAINMNTVPKDPTVNFGYSYGLTHDNRYYQVATALESNQTSFINQTYANNYTSKVVGNYKGLYKFSTGGVNYIMNLPSLIFTQTGTIQLETPVNPKFVINNGGNLVKPYDNNNTETVTTILEKLTHTGGINLVAQPIPTTFEEWKTQSGTLQNTLGYSPDDIGVEIYGKEYASGNSNLQVITPPAPVVYASCSFSGNTITHGSSVTAYETASVTFGNTCTSEQRTCNDGVLSGGFENGSCNVDGATGTFTLSANTTPAGQPITITNNCSVAPTSYASSNGAVAVTSGNTVLAIEPGTTVITPVGGACSDNAGKNLTVTAPICSNFTYSAWGSCKANNTQTRTITSQTPSGCTGGTPVLQQSCTVTPWRDLLGTSCDNDDYVFTQGGTTYRWAGCNSVLGNGIEWGSTTSCFNYAGNQVSCGTSAQMLSTAKENAWNATAGTQNNIWGKLYNYTQATSGACPSDWHLPSDAEWTALETFLKGSLCRTGSAWQCEGLGWKNNHTQNLSNNIIQALKLPLAGSRDSDGVSFGSRGNFAFLWSTEISTRRFYWSFDTVLRNPQDASNSFSVRCVKD